MAEMGLLEGAAEFERREGEGFRLLQRLFGRIPICYGQPGNSWGPQSNLALRRWGVPVYMDAGNHVGFEQQLMWYGGLFYVCNLGPFTVRTSLESTAGVNEAVKQFDSAVEELRLRGGGVMQTYYHPCEFANHEFAEAINFRHDARPEPSDWKLPPPRSAESAELAYRNFFAFVDHVRATKGLRVITPSELLSMVEPQVA